MKLINFFYPKALGFVAPAPAAVPVVKDSPIKRILNEAANVIDEKGWCQNDIQDLQGKVCTIGAIIFSARKIYSSMDGATRRDLTMLAVKEVHEVLGDSISSWNDNLLFFGAARVKRVLRQTAKRVRV